MRNKKVGIGNGKWGFYFFLLLTSYFLLLTLFMPEDVVAQGGWRQRTPKYSLWGDITLRYDDVNSSGSHQSTFFQNYNLNFRSYVISPKIMTYTINAGFDRLDTIAGTAQKSTGKSYGIATRFFKDKPFNFSINASRTDFDSYKRTDYGLSMAYTRSMRKIYRPPAPPAEVEEVNKNNNLNINTNTNKNLNMDKDDEEGNVNVNTNVAPSPKPEIKRKSNMFRDILDGLPVTTVLDIDRATTENGTSKSTWESGILRTFGMYRRTSYNWNFDYSKVSNMHRALGTDLSTSTTLDWRFFKFFDNSISYRTNDITSYSINSAARGSSKTWNYYISGVYAFTGNSESARQYGITASALRIGPYFTYKGINVGYGLNFGLQRSNNNKGELFATGYLSAAKRISRNTDLSSSLSVTGSTLGAAFSFSTGISYIFVPRKGYIARIEFDPKNQTLTTHTFKPQVVGWDYFIRTGYSFGISRDTRGKGTNKTVINHTANLGVYVYIREFTFSSDANLYYSNANNKSFMWNNSVYTTVMRKIGITIGTGLTKDMPADGSGTTNYNIYNLITYRILRNLSLRVNSRYSKVMPPDTTTIEFAPSLTWAWRQVSVALDVSLKRDKPSSGAATKERRIMLRVTRPFRIL